MEINLKRVFFGGLFLAVLSVYSQTASPLTGGLVVKGKINGISSGTVSITTEVFAEKKTFDASISQGKFEVRINQPSPTLYSLSVKEDPTGRLLFFADNGIAQIEATKGNLDNAKVSGSISHKEFVQYNTMVSNYDFLLNTIQEVWADLQEKGTLLPKADSLQKVFKRTTEKKDSSIAGWVMKYNKSFVSPLVMILNYANNGDPVSMRNMFNGFSADVKMSYYGNYLDGIITRKEGLNIGKSAPLFSQADPEGKPVSLESFRGKYLLVDFWASWCGPCRQENPNIVRTYEKFKGNNFEILGVSLDNNKDKWLKAIQDDQLTWAQVSDLKYWKNAVAVQYGVQSIPANFLLDKEGKIIAKGLRGPALEQALEKILAPK
jgi:peroxiredoxin